MLQFCLIWIECIRKVLHKSFFFFSIQAHFDPRNHLWKFTSSAILIPPSLLWRHEWNLCPPEVKNIFGTFTSACVVQFPTRIFSSLTLVKQCVVGSCNNSNKTGHSTHFFFQKKKEFGASGSKLNVQTSYSLQNTLKSVALILHTNVLRMMRW